MDMKVAGFKLTGLLGAAAALSTMNAAQAAPAGNPELPQASSYRDLIDPIPNALPLLSAEDERLAAAVSIDQWVRGRHENAG